MILTTITSKITLKEIPKTQFRLSSKKLLLTYPKCDIDINEMLKLLNHKHFIQIKKYFIVKEKHEDNTSHIHIFLELIKKCNIRNSKLLDIEYNGNNYHGNYQTCKYKNKTLEYLSKDLNENNHITNINLNKDYNEMTVEELAIIHAEKYGMQKGLEFYKDNASIKNQINTIHKIQRCIQIRDKINKNRLINLGVIHNPQFNEWPKQLIEASNNFKESTKPMSIALTGKSGTGKTQAALSIAKSKYKDDEIFYGRAHIDCLKELKDEHKCIILDEVNKDMFRNIDQLKGFLDNSQGTTLDVKHSSVTIDNKRDKILISNSSIKDIAIQLSKNEQDIIAVLRRIKHSVTIDKSLFIVFLK